MKKLQFVSRLVLAAAVLLWTAGRVFLPLPDWGVRVNVVIMMAAMAALVFATVRLKVKNS